VIAEPTPIRPAAPNISRFIVRFAIRTSRF
jgi:hypothetical protein